MTMTVWKMRKTNRKYSPVALSAFLAGWLLLCCLGPERVLGQTAVSRLGTVIPLPGHISEMVVDEARGQIYAANFSAGRVEVVSMTTRRRLGSILTSSSPSAITAMAMTHDSRYLVVTSVPVSETPGSTVTVINIKDPGDRRFFTVVDRPLAMAFGANGEGLFVSAAGFQIFDPVTGTFTDVFSFGDGSSDDVDLPVAGHVQQRVSDKRCRRPLPVSLYHDPGSPCRESRRPERDPYPRYPREPRSWRRTRSGRRSACCCPSSSEASIY